MKKLDIAKLLNRSPNVSAKKEEIVQFFYSTQFDAEEEDEGSIIEDFLYWRKDTEREMIEMKDWSLDKTFLKGKTSPPPKLPKKVIKQMEEERLAFLKSLED